MFLHSFQISNPWHHYIPCLFKYEWSFLYVMENIITTFLFSILTIHFLLPFGLKMFNKKRMKMASVHKQYEVICGSLVCVLLLAILISVIFNYITQETLLGLSVALVLFIISMLISALSYSFSKSCSDSLRYMSATHLLSYGLLLAVFLKL